jgi:formylmethanofuran dehydrogenase subunit E
MRFHEELLKLHAHVCPRQVLGVRMGELASQLLVLPLPQQNKRLFVFVETDGCFADGVMVATGCSMGHRTMRLLDHGKVAATFVDTQASPLRAVRVWPSPAARDRALELSPDIASRSRWHAQLEAYQAMPDRDLLAWRDVELTLSLQAIISRAGVRVTCVQCGEEIINERQVVRDGVTLCRHCAGDGYYRPTSQQ